jgi:integrase
VNFNEHSTNHFRDENAPVSLGPRAFLTSGLLAAPPMVPGMAALAQTAVRLSVLQPAFNLRLRAACQALGVRQITAHGLRHSAATILLNHVGKDFREIQERLRHENIRTTVRYTHVGYEQTRQTSEALSRVLE